MKYESEVILFYFLSYLFISKNIKDKEREGKIFKRKIK